MKVKNLKYRLNCKLKDIKVICNNKKKCASGENEKGRRLDIERLSRDSNTFKRYRVLNSSSPSLF